MGGTVGCSPSRMAAVSRSMPGLLRTFPLPVFSHELATRCVELVSPCYAVSLRVALPQAEVRRKAVIE